MLNRMSDDEWRLARLERLGLKEDPFKLSADPRYLYLGPEHSGCLSPGARSHCTPAWPGVDHR